MGKSSVLHRLIDYLFFRGHIQSYCLIGILHYSEQFVAFKIYSYFKVW